MSSSHSYTAAAETSATSFPEYDTLVLNTLTSVATAAQTDTTFTWTILNFSGLAKKHDSDVFVVGGYEWRVTLHPKGYDVPNLGIFLHVANFSRLSRGWTRYAEFKFSVVDQFSNQHTVRKELKQKFDAKKTNSGVSLMPLSELWDLNRGFLVNDTLVVEIQGFAGEVAKYLSYDSKKETGYVGLESQEETSYLSCLLQTLYHIPAFRKVDYKLPMTEIPMPSTKLSLELQKLFYQLQYSDRSVALKDLIKSFGGDAKDATAQYHAPELNWEFRKHIEGKMKGIYMEGTNQKLFEGHCNVMRYKSKRTASFYDLHLDVKGCRDVYASFDKYVHIGRLEGKNKHWPERHALQDAGKCVRFVYFPPVLQINLNWFEHDFMRSTMVKINAGYEFPLELDLDIQNGKYLSPAADRKVRNLYMLHSVLVHNGREHGGRYHVFIRPTSFSQWFKFDGERVTKEDLNITLEEQDGVKEELDRESVGNADTPSKYTNFTNAHRLVYVRMSDMDRIYCTVNGQNIAEHEQVRLKREHEKREHNSKKESHVCTNIKVSMNTDFLKPIPREIYSNLVDHDNVHCFRIQNWTSFCNFKEQVAEELGVPVQCQRFWLWEKRQNRIYRPRRPLTPEEETQSVGQLSQFSNEDDSPELKLFLEVEFGTDLHPIRPRLKTKDDILLFFKLYDPIKEELSYVGRIFVNSTMNIWSSNLYTKLCKMADFSLHQEVNLYKDVKFDPTFTCEAFDKTLSFGSNQVVDGDVLYFQKSPAIGNGQQFLYSDVPSFLKFLHNRKIVHFRSLEKPKEEDFSLELSKLDSYNVVVERVACVLGVNDPSRITITSHDPSSQQPTPTSIDPMRKSHLSDMLVQISDILYYQVLEPEAGPSTSTIQLSAPSSSCVVCFDAPLEGACVPCGHLSGCMSCLNEIKGKKMGCPVCRAKIQLVVRIYSA